MAAVTLENLTKSFPEKSGPDLRAVKCLNLVIREREFMVLAGPSGCGKSTTLRMIARLDKDIHFADTGVAVGPVVAAKLEIHEPRGAETFLHPSAGAASCIARVRATASFYVGQAVNPVLDLAKAHLFDAATEQILP